MHKNQKKRFPFFTIPRPKFLEADLKKIDDFVVMLRITPKITLLNYNERIIYLAAFIIYSFIIIIQILYIVLNVPFPNLMRFILRDGLAVIANIFGVPIPPAQRETLPLFFLLILLLIGAVWILSQTRHAFRDVRGLRRLHTMTPQQRSAFSLEQFLRISLPVWLSPTVTYEPTPEEFLTVLRERERARTGHTQAIAEELARGEETEEAQEETPSFRPILTLTDQLSCTLLGPSGKRFMMRLNDAPASLVGFLATREPGTWTAREEFFKSHLYSIGQENLFTRHRERTNAQIIARAQQEGFLPQTPTKQEPEDRALADTPPTPAQDEHDGELSGDDASSPRPGTGMEETITLFEHKTERGVSYWRLTSQCSSEVFPFLTTFFPKVMRAEASPQDPTLMSLEEVRQGCDRLMKEYGNGFLADHVKGNDSLWAWALPLYRQYRDQCLGILSYALQRESEAIDILTDPRDQHTALAAIAQVHGWRAIVATGLDLMEGGTFSEENIVECLSYYRQMRKRADAKEVYQKYHELRSRNDPSYKPGKALQTLVDAFVYLKKNKSGS